MCYAPSNSVTIPDLNNVEKTQELDRKYTLLDLIGTGGMAEVYRAKLVGQQGFEKPLVIKQLLADVAGDREVVENFIDEAKLAAFLHHENIACVYDFGNMDGSYFIAMEYLFGKDLHSVMAKARSVQRPVSVPLALHIASQICSGMDYAHNLTDLEQKPLNIIHRDLTPHNVFLTYDGKVKIIDFGVAKAELFDNRTRAGVVKGKVSYMSPEQLVEADVDARSDIFSIGILLYEMISGVRMYQGDTATLIKKCINVIYRPLEEMVPGLDTKVYDILRNALQKEPDNRYQSCGDMLDDINEYFFSKGLRPNSKPVKELLLDLFQDDYEGELQRFTPGGTLQRKLTEEDLGEDDKTVFAENPFIETPKWYSHSGRYTLWAVLGIGFCVVILASVNMALDKRKRTEVAKTKQALEVAKVESVKVTQETKATEKRAPAVKQLAKPVINIKPLQIPVEVQVEKELDDEEIMKRAVGILIADGEKALAANRLTLPDGESARDYFNKVLDLEPDNVRAKEGLRIISERYAVFAAKKLAEGEKDEALEKIEKGLAVQPENEELLTMKTDIEQEEQERVDQLFDKATAAFQAGRYTTPADTSAYFYLREIEKIRPQSPLVQQGKLQIADKYDALGDKALQNMNLQKARQYTRAGLMVMPGHQGLLELQSDLQKSKPAIFMKGLSRSFRPLFD